jgi:hypothetical protein
VAGPGFSAGNQGTGDAVSGPSSAGPGNLYLWLRANGQSTAEAYEERIVRGNTVGLAGKPLKRGEHRVTTNDSNVTLGRGGKVVAEAPVEWHDETNKPKSSTIEITTCRVKGIRFSGKIRYVVIAE